MSNNDLRHKKCGSQHHPMDCPDDNNRLTDLLWKVTNDNVIIVQNMTKPGMPMADYAKARDESIAQARTQIIELFLGELPDKDYTIGHYIDMCKCEACISVRSHNELLATIREKWGEV